MTNYEANFYGGSYTSFCPFQGETKLNPCGRCGASFQQDGESYCSFGMLAFRLSETDVCEGLSALQELPDLIRGLMEVLDE